MITLKKPVIIKLKNYTLIWKSKKENIKYYGSNPATVEKWYKILSGV
jgi:hypothetical protein